MVSTGLSKRGVLAAVLLLGVVLVVAAVMAVVPASAQSDADAEMEAVIDAIWTEYTATTAVDADRWIALWDDNGVQMPPGSMPVIGKEAIYERVGMEKSAAFDVDMEIMNKEFEVAGEWAFCRGMYTVKSTPKEGGETTELNGKYMTILQKQPDGTWKLYRDIFNSNTP